LVRGRGTALIEHKAGTPEDCLRLLREKHLIKRLVVQSFDWEFLRRLHELEPALLLGALGPPFRLAHGRKPLHLSRGLNRAWLHQAGETGAKVVVWNWRVSKGAVRLAHTCGLKVWVYTVNRPRLARRLIRTGVDGLITNEPALLRELTRKD